MKDRNNILIGGGALVAIFVMICGCCLVFNVVRSMSNTNDISTQPTRTPLPKLVTTEEPSIPTPEPPTPTEVPPSPTMLPSPTSTPVVSPTATQVSELGLPVAVQLYVLEIVDKSQIMAEALQELGQLLQNPEPNDDNWIVSTALQVTLIQNVHKELASMDVPVEMTEVHAAILDATRDCNTSMDYLVSGIDNWDSNDIETAGSYMTQCSEKLPEAAKLMEEHIAQYE